MLSLSDRVHAEMQNISTVLAELEKVKDRPDKECVVLVGMGALLQSVYTGMENILKQILQHRGVKLPETRTWHKDILALAVEEGLLSGEFRERIGRYLMFRHFFSHSYAFLMDEAKLMPLVEDVFEVYSDFAREVEQSLTQV